MMPLSDTAYPRLARSSQYRNAGCPSVAGAGLHSSLAALGHGLSRCVHPEGMKKIMSTVAEGSIVCVKPFVIGDRPPIINVNESNVTEVELW